MRFDKKTKGKINKVLASAYKDGRDILYEYEVYDILKAIGLKVPEHILVRRIQQIDEKKLQKFGQSLVIKVVSPQIIHKQKVGGVSIVHNPRVENVREAIKNMVSDIHSHYKDTEKPTIVGFLLVEFVPFTQALGYETLIGFKMDPAFGPVLTVSKGGDDAEFFAKYYDPANLIIPPFDFEQSLETLRNLNIRHKFEAIGHGEYLEYMAKASSELSSLAYDFSYMARQKPEYVITEMDINPFVITKDHRFIAVDGFAKFTCYEEKPQIMANKDNLKLFFRPKGVAVIGVSADMSRQSMAREIAHQLYDLGRNDLYFVNPRGGELEFDGKKYRLYKSFSEIRDNVELIIYAAPAQFMIEFISELPQNSPKAVILISGIPSEVKYSDFKAQMAAVVPNGTRIIGPNCIGVFNAGGIDFKGINTFFLDEKRLEVKCLERSNTALLTQSGALAITVIDKMKVSHLFKTVVSFGNKYDVNAVDLVSYFAHDDGIDLISVYMEGLDAGEGRSFFDIAKTVAKPIIVYKSGKTEAGARAAASHTASMSGSYEVFKAACQQAGVILAEKIEDYEDYMKVFSLLSHRIPAGNRVAGVLNAGFESAVGADELKNLKQAVLSQNTVEKLKRIDRYGLTDTSSSFLDITPSSDDSVFADFVEAVLQDDNVDCVFVANVPHTNALKSDPDSCHDSDSLAKRLADIAKKFQKPIVVSINGGLYYQELVKTIEKSGLPVYRDIRSSIKSLDRFVTYHLGKAKSKDRCNGCKNLYYS